MERISRKLAKLLRHRLRSIDPGVSRRDGFVPLDAVLALAEFDDVDEAEVREVVRQDAKQRYALSAEDGVVFIRANQGHSGSSGVDDELLLQRLDERTASELGGGSGLAVHGTVMKNWPLIVASGGLLRMTRNHVHMAPYMHASASRSAGEWPQAAGLRSSSDVLIMVDVVGAIRAGTPMFLSHNGVVLTPGQGNEGLLPLEHFHSAMDRRTGRMLWLHGKLCVDAPSTIDSTVAVEAAEKAETDFGVGVQGRTSTHFLPKFDNENSAAEERLTSRVGPSMGGCLAISKKHSGHLVMAPPFYAKNSVGNRFSRMGAYLLLEHFNAVWGERDGSTKFAAWWLHAERLSLSYSFECVVPSLCGDHGATPEGAYMVLTCASHATSGTFLSPAQLLVLATKWRLPLNEVWYVPWQEASAVEEALHAARWTMKDADAQRLLSGCGAYQSFLSHGQTQGEVLEGFVLLALNTSTEALMPLIERYEEEISPHRGAALETTRRIGAAALRCDEVLTAQLDRPSETWEGWPADALPKEPRAIELETESVWEKACASGGALGGLFQTLRALYSHRVALRTYVYRDVLQIQVQIKDDQIFYGWPLHMELSGVAPLFRGMVVSFDDPFDGEGGGSFAMDDLVTIPSAEILGVAKLKCLNYLVRTFGVRNALPTLRNKGATAYLARSNRFFTNWGVPVEHHLGVRRIFTGWTNEFARLSAGEKAGLTSKNYLRYLEPYLHRLETGVTELSEETGATELSEEQRPLAAALKRLVVMICNLSGEQLPASVLETFAPGMVGCSYQHGSRATVGSVCVLDAPPRANKEINDNTLILVIPPCRDADQKWLSMFATLEKRRAESYYPDGCLHFKSTPAVWREAVAKKTATRPTVAGADDSATLPVRTVVMVVALPPGGGKSTFFAALKETAGVAIVSSDDVRAQGGSPKLFDRALREALVESDDGQLIAYDKNIPDAKGLAKAVQVLDEIGTDLGIQIRVLPIVPGCLEHDCAWQRVSCRPPTDASLNVHAIGDDKTYQLFREVFFEPSAAFLSTAQSLPGAVVSNAFWGDQAAARQLATSIGAAAGIGAEAPLGELLEAFERTDGLAPSWACASLPATRLHVTLVPPPGDLRDPRGGGGGGSDWERQRVAALSQLRQVAGSQVKVELLRYVVATSGARRMGFWEVAPQMEGMAEGLHLPAQRAIYHVTDLGALVGTRPRDCPVLLVAMQQAKRAGEKSGPAVVVEETEARLTAAEKSETRLVVQLEGSEWIVSELVLTGTPRGEIRDLAVKMVARVEIV